MLFLLLGNLWFKKLIKKGKVNKPALTRDHPLHVIPPVVTTKPGKKARKKALSSAFLVIVITASFCGILQVNSRSSVRIELAVALRVELNQVYVREMKTRSGTRTTLGIAHVYEDPETALRVEPKHIIERNMSAASQEPEQEPEPEPGPEERDEEEPKEEE